MLLDVDAAAESSAAREDDICGPARSRVGAAGRRLALAAETVEPLLALLQADRRGGCVSQPPLAERTANALTEASHQSYPAHACHNRTGSKVEQVALPCVVLIYRRRESPTEIISSVCPKPAERASARASRRRSHVGLAASSSTTTGAILPTW